MRNLPTLALDAADMFQYPLAADARISRTHYADDQAWTVELGAGDRAAMAFQTQYGGRAGLVSLVPIWRVADAQRYQARHYSDPPIVTHFAPNLLRLQARITPQLPLIATYWVMESRAAGGEFTLENTGDEALDLQLELFGHVAIKGRNRKLNVLTLGDYSLALHLGQIGDINPVLTLEGASHEIYGGRISSPKLGGRLTLNPGARARIPFVVAGLPDLRDSHSVAMNWMSRDWVAWYERIDQAALAVPKARTGVAEWDQLIDLSYATLLKAIMRGTERLPHASFVANRAGHRGWSRRGDGRDHIRAWAGQDPTLACLILPALATIEPDMAKGILRNYLAAGDESGFIDRQPGLGGQRQGLLMMPILARLAWMIHERCDSRDFIAQVFPPLLGFFQRWQGSDMDADGDGAPEWQSERQLGYVAFPTFGMGQGWSQGADIRRLETPDLLAYLCSEARALIEMAALLGDEGAEQALRVKLDQLRSLLDEFWTGERYAYRDRDSHRTEAAIELLRGGAGDALHEINQALPAANRVILRVVGGVSQRPRIRLQLKGRDENQRPCQINADADEFLWHNRQGIYTTQVALSAVDSIEIKGLSRVFKVYASTIDSSRLDINHLLPLWSGEISEERAGKLAALALDERHFLRENGITMVSAMDRNFDPSNALGGGGIWMYWMALIGDGLLKAGYRQEATDLVKRALTSLSRILEREGHLSQFYHADEIQGFGERHHVGGILPLSLLSDVIGIRIDSPSKVQVGGAFTWGQEIQIQQHGVTVVRSAGGIQIDFPSGHRQSLPAEPEWGAVIDPAPAMEADAEDELPPAPESDLPSQSDDETPIVIDLDGAGASDGAPDDDDQPPPVPAP